MDPCEIITNKFQDNLILVIAFWEIDVRKFSVIICNCMVIFCSNSYLIKYHIGRKAAIQNSFLTRETTTSKGVVRVDFGFIKFDKTDFNPVPQSSVNGANVQNNIQHKLYSPPRPVQQISVLSVIIADPLKYHWVNMMIMFHPVKLIKLLLELYTEQNLAMSP